MNNNNSTVTTQQVLPALDDYQAEDLYEILVRNHYYMPQRGQWLTKKVMLQIFIGAMYCPKYEEVVVRPCPHPPSKLVLLAEINKEITKSARLGSNKTVPGAGTRLPDARWLLDVLATLNPKHELFSKTYYACNKPKDPFLNQKVEFLKCDALYAHPIFQDLPSSLLIRRKSFKKCFAPAFLQPQVSR